MQRLINSREIRFQAVARYGKLRPPEFADGKSLPLGLPTDQAA
jgi:hypothetical protein